MRSRLSYSLDEFLDEVAQRGSWLGGGSVAALSASLAGALLEKLTAQPLRAQQLRTIRRHCARLIRQDAVAFARVIQATRAQNRQIFARSLKAATEIQYQVVEHARAIAQACRMARRVVSPRLQSDLRCAQSLAQTAEQAARVLIGTNLTWLNDRRYTSTVQRRLRSTRRSAGS